MQEVHTRRVRCVPRSSTRTGWRFGSQRRFVLFMAWLTLLPAIGPFPHTSQRFAIVFEPFAKRSRKTAVSNRGPGQPRDGTTTGFLAQTQRANPPLEPACVVQNLLPCPPLESERFVAARAKARSPAAALLTELAVNVAASNVTSLER
jgi:hypothetical protein